MIGDKKKLSLLYFGSLPGQYSLPTSTGGGGVSYDLRHIYKSFNSNLVKKHMIE